LTMTAIARSGRQADACGYSHERFGAIARLNR
jgi:hypothetical protein